MSRAMHSVATVHYPDSDGQPMAETHFQRRAMFYLLTALPLHFRDREDVYVSGDMFLYYEEGNPAAVVAPDVFVATGAPKRADAPRRTYKLWEEPTGPDFVMEVVSDSTWQADREEKPELYAALGVRSTGCSTRRGSIFGRGFGGWCWRAGGTGSWRRRRR